MVAVGADDDDMVEFLKSLGLKGAVGFLELSITGVPLLHIVASGIHNSFVRSDIQTFIQTFIHPSVQSNHSLPFCHNVLFNLHYWTFSKDLLLCWYCSYYNVECKFIIVYYNKLTVGCRMRWLLTVTLK